MIKEDITFLQKRLQLTVDKVYNDSVKKGKKRDWPIDVWISRIPIFIDWYDLSML